MRTPQEGATLPASSIITFFFYFLFISEEQPITVIRRYLPCLPTLANLMRFGRTVGGNNQTGLSSFLQTKARHICDVRLSAQNLQEPVPHAAT